MPLGRPDGGVEPGPETDPLAYGRQLLDGLNSELVDAIGAIGEILTRRHAIVDEHITPVKEALGLPTHDPDREARIITGVRDLAVERDVSPDLVESFFRTIFFAESIKRQHDARTEART